MTTHLTHSHVNATIILANVKVEIFVVNPQMTSFRQFAFEPLGVEEFTQMLIFLYEKRIK